MKQFLLASATGFISLLTAANGAFAQNSVNTEILQPQKNITEVEKSVSPNGRAIVLTFVSPKAIRDFTSAYKNVSNENWEKVNDGFTAKFNLGGIMNTVYYGNRGQWTGSLKGYTEDKLPTEIRKIVKREYYDYSITYVQEAQTLDSKGIPTYIIHLEDKNTIKLLRIFDGEMEVWQEYKKQS